MTDFCIYPGFRARGSRGASLRCRLAKESPGKVQAELRQPERPVGMVVKITGIACGCAQQGRVLLHPPPAEIPGIEILELEDAVQLLKNQIYAEAVWVVPVPSLWWHRKTVKYPDT